MKGRGARLVAGNEDEVRDILGLVGKVFDRIYELGQSWFLGESKGGTEKGVRDALVQLGVGADRLDNILKNPKERVEMAARILKKGRQATVPKPGKIRAVVNVKPDADIGRWKIFYPEHGYLYEKPKEGKGPSRVKIAGVGPTLDKSKIDYPYSEGQYPVEVIGGRKPPRESGAVSKATKKAPASETSQPAPRPPATKTTPSSTGSLPADSIPQWELVGEPARAGMRANVEGLALAINQELASYLQGEEVERALDAVEAIKPEINRRRKRGRWVALSVIVSAPVSVDLGKEIATDLKQIVFFSN
ncbi:MAG: hypothetical protein ACXV3D_06695, partial [Halobacteriota archaeon]